MIKYLGSKRKLVGAIGDVTEQLVAAGDGGGVVCDLFTGTTRVAQEFKKRRMYVFANDKATYSKVFADTYIGLDASELTDADKVELRDVIQYLQETGDHATKFGDAVGGGGFTEEYCRKARYFSVANGQRIDAIRDEIEDWYAGDWKYPVLLTSLIEAADRVDSTVGVQMAYLKEYASRALSGLELRIPELLPGAGHGMCRDALDVAKTIGDVDVCYLDPPYNQHSYYGNYHIWETLVKWDWSGSGFGGAAGYGVANKRSDVRDAENKSDFNSKRRVGDALASVTYELAKGGCKNIVVSYSDEGFLTRDEVEAYVHAAFGPVTVLAIEGDRYIGRKLGVYGPGGRAAGARSGGSGAKNTEYLFVAGENVSALDNFA